MSKNYVSVNNLKISKDLLSFINNELLKGIDISPDVFWLKFDEIIHELTPKNKKQIKKKNDLQKKIDDWHIQNKGTKIKLVNIKNF